MLPHSRATENRRARVLILRASVDRLRVAEREWLDTKQELPNRKETGCTIEEFAALAAREPAYDDSARSNRSTNDGQTPQGADR
jgi:hypothetical protein